MLAGCSRLIGVPGDGVIKGEDRPIPEFTRIEVSGAYQINWTDGKPSLKISADQNLLPLINTSVTGNAVSYTHLALSCE